MTDLNDRTENSYRTESFVVQLASDVEVGSEFHETLVEALFQLADDDLTIGHRDSQWLGIAPDIEEDVAFSSIAQDEVGHSSLFYWLLSDLGMGNPDELAFQRKAEERKSAWLVERENGDWAYSVVRHYVYDVFEDIRLSVCADSIYIPLRNAAKKIQREEYYHLLHGETLLRYLTHGGTEAKSRIQASVRDVWRDLDNLFSLGSAASALERMAILPATTKQMRTKWEMRVIPELEMLGLDIPAWPAVGAHASVRGQSHIPPLSKMLEELREVVDSEMTATW